MTSSYYDRHGEQYFEQTKHVDMTDVYHVFLHSIPHKGYILDAGCGSGRDSRYFLAQGYQVLAIDASATMARLASAYLGQTVLHQKFTDLQQDAVFDGIWASASLLHTPRGELKDTFQCLANALKQGGVFYASFKWGTTERTVEGRLFTDFDDEAFQAFVTGIPALTVNKLWKTPDKTRPNTFWLNLLLQKTS
jgi:SAM-dependent methyltransferase